MMNENIKINKIWVIFILIGTVSFIYGYYFKDFLLEGLGALSSAGALFCIIFELLMKLFRKMRGQRFK
ncbi:hypothetical protein [Lactococcus garvieae]|uniref:hypothetical protein n=1 Tax=Lactococcus garvieae TaxID=1363 RepID=UPI0022E5528B|nr:hypothetical protein [Lactococcus garvieae]